MGDAHAADRTDQARPRGQPSTWEPLQRAAIVSAGAAALLALVALLGWASGLRRLAGLRLDYIPMAPDTALCFLLLATTPLISSAGRRSNWGTLPAAITGALVASYGVLAPVEYLTGVRLTLGHILYPVTEMLGAYPVGRMSPITGILFCLSGAAVLLGLLARSRRTTLDAASGLGAGVALGGFMGAVGYLSGTPLLYGGSVIPMAAPTTVAFLLSGVALVAVAGREGLVLRPFVGPSVRARLLRTFLPLTAAMLLGQAFLRTVLAEPLGISRGLGSALFVMLFAGVAGIVVVWAARGIARIVDAVEAKRRRAEEALGQTNQRLQALVDAAPVAIFTLAADDTIQMWNPAAERILGWREEEVIGQPSPMVAPEARAEFRLRRERLSRGEAVTDFEVRRTRHDGTPVDLAVSTAPLYDAQGRLAGTVYLAADISDRKQAEEALQESEARYRTLVETSPDAIVLTDLNGKFMMANRGAAVLAHVESAAQMIGRSVLEFVAPEDLPRAAEGLQNALESGILRVDQYSLVRGDGTRVPVEYSASPVMDPQGRPQAFVGVIRDVSERKQAEARLLQAQKMEAVGRLTAGIAHDFNNLLTAINGFAELVQLRLTPEDPLGEMVGRILHSGRRAADLVRQLMAFSRQEDFQPRVLNLNAVVSEMETMLHRIIGEDIELKTALGHDLWPVKADPTQIEQVLANLVVNARHAMPAGGRLAIKTANVTLSRRHAMPGATPGDYVLLSVRDSGVGMTEEVKARIFEPFFTTKEKGKGTGLGLATVYGIVHGSGGHIYVDSEPGKGTTFSVYMPRTLEEAPVATTGLSEDQPSAGHETILLVEDDETVRGLAQFVLDGQGYAVIAARTGDEGLASASQHARPIDLLVTDMVLPGRGGMEVADLLRNTYPAVKVLFISGYSDELAARQGDLAPGAAFLSKPFTALDLARKVRRLLDS
jgi:two-component system cell cycle sensor histidine kinase/response regulator CckA